MTRRPLAAALLAAGVLATGVLSVAPVAAAVPVTQVQGPPECERASAEAPVLVLVETLAPRAPVRPDQAFQVAGRLVNCGSEPVTGLDVRLGIGPLLDSRSGVAAADAEPVAGRRVLSAPAEAEELAPGAQTRFDLRLLTRDLALGGRNGVFPLSVQARGGVGEDERAGQLGLGHTFVPWFPDGPIAPTRIAWVLPLVDQPHRGPGEVVLDEALEALLKPETDEDGPRGRLAGILAAGASGSTGTCDAPAKAPEGAVADPARPCRGEPVPLTYALDPDLLYSVEAMTARNGYTVLRGDEQVDRPMSASAERFLVALRAAAGNGTDVLALPYGDPDVAALASTGAVASDVEALRRLGTLETAELLGEEPLRSLQWLPPGPLRGALDEYAGGEVQTVLVEEDSLDAGDPSSPRTPNARTTLPASGTGIGALVVDAGLTALVEADPASPTWQTERVAEQRWIAEAAVITAETPSVSRTLVVAPGRRASLVPSVAAGAMADTGRLPWLCPVSLAKAAAGTERCTPGPDGLVDTQAPAASEPRGRPRPPREDDRELTARQLAGLAAVREDSEQFTEQVLVAGSEQAATTETRLLRARGRAASTAWREEPAPGARLLRLLSEDVDNLRQRIRLVNVRPVTLTGSSGRIVLTVENAHDQPVNVGVSLPRSGAVRLESADTAVQVVPADTAVDVSVRVEARTSGRFTTKVVLLDASGRPFGREAELQVRSTQYGRVALGITGVAAAVLLVAAGARITRRALRRPAAVVEEPVVPAAPGSGV